VVRLWHGQATRMKNTAFVFCPRHGGAVHHHRGRPLGPLLNARRRLDAALHLDVGSKREVYVLQVLGLKPDAVYVGETSKARKVRAQEHAGGHHAGKVFKHPGVTVGPLRQDLVPETAGGPLQGQSQAWAAEQWTGFVLREHGYTVYGGH
jgi:hypothetical protein